MHLYRVHPIVFPFPKDLELRKILPPVTSLAIVWLEVVNGLMPSHKRILLALFMLFAFRSEFAGRLYSYYL